jgi:bacillithiol biosynthesis cysteine-adding enzyme BshC
MIKLSAKAVDFYTPIIQDYLDQKLNKSQGVNWDYNWETLEQQAKERSLGPEIRNVLVDVLQEQYASVQTSEAVQQNIQKLKSEHSRTITTGHQITLFGGPLFVFSKVFEVIELSKQMKVRMPELDFVPVLWFASEDHDFTEISKVKQFNQEFIWESDQTGAVGRMHLKELQGAKRELLEKIGDKGIAAHWQKIIDEAYSEENSLSKAMLILINEVFKDEGLVILEPDHPKLKSIFLPVAQKELKERFVEKAVETQSEKLSEYKLLVNPREVNLFYLSDGVRSRIIIENDEVSLDGVEGRWSLEAFLKLSDEFPGILSPNVTLRPVYQEIILPNIAYVGGAGEISYWLQLVDVFAEAKVAFPLPMVRTSFTLLREKQINKVEEFGMQMEDMFLRPDLLENRYVEKQSTDEINLGEYKGRISKMFEELQEKGVAIDSNLKKVVLGEQKRALGVIENLEKRFRGAEKQHHAQAIQQLENIRTKVFPEETFQERKEGFVQFIIMLGLPEMKALYQNKSSFFQNDLVFLSY